MSELRRVRPIPFEPAADASIHVAATLVTTTIVVGLLYWARDVLVPLTLAVLLSFLLAPVVKLIRSVRVPRPAAVAIVMTFTAGVIFGVGALVSSQLGSLASSLPQYEQNIKNKIRDVRSAQTSGGFLDKATDAIEDMKKEMTSENTASSSQPAPTPPILGGTKPASSAQQPPTVKAEPADSAFELVQKIAKSVLGPLAGAALVMLLTIFILLQREDLRDRFIRLFGARDLNRTTVAMNDAASRLSRYFFLQACLNTCFGLITGCALALIGIPSPALWGVVAGLMRFIPYVGSVLAAIPPVLLAAAVDPGWSMAIWTGVFFLAAEPIMGHLIEPLVYGRQTGLSPMAVVASATFWTWLWGPIGLILATPLTLCLVVVGQHATRLEFLNVLLGDQPALTPEQSFYQRLLAGDAVEVSQQAETALKTSSLISYYDEVALPGLRLAVSDEQAGALEKHRIVEVSEALDDLIDALDRGELGLGKDAIRAAAASRALTQSTSNDEHGMARIDAAATGEKDEADTPVTLDESWTCDGAIFVLPGRGDLDRAAARMLAQLLSKAGFGAVAGDKGGLSEIGTRLGAESASRRLRRLVVASVGGVTPSQMQFLVRRIHRNVPNVPVIAGAFALDEDDQQLEWLRENSGASTVAATFRAVVSDVLRNASCEDVRQLGEEAAAQEPRPETRAVSAITAPAA